MDIVFPSGDRFAESGTYSRETPSSGSSIERSPVTTMSYPAASRPRVAFYSHDTMGMGHLRRNLLIASSLAGSSVQAEALLIAGAREAAFFAEQAGLDCITLPSLSKNIEGRYSGKHFSWSLSEMTELRSRVIASALLGFKPDVLIVDKVPQGIGDELKRTLKLIRHRLQTRCVLGLRDVLDEPHVVQAEWLKHGYQDVIENYFDEVWIYGDRQVYDGIAEYQFSSTMADRSHFVGYLDQSQRNQSQSCSDRKAGIADKSQPMVLCVVGGGQDGYELASSFVEAGVPSGWKGVVITGPFMPAEQRKSLMSRASGAIEIIDRLVETDDYLQQADRVIAMGGYNTVTAILSFGKPSLIVPRVRPRQEQWIRAEKLSQRGWVSCLHPDQLNSIRIREWMEQETVPVPQADGVDLNGLSRIQTRVTEICRSRNGGRALAGKRMAI